jgi:rhodanese-related sulfurtransferase
MKWVYIGIAVILLIAVFYSYSSGLRMDVEEARRRLQKKEIDKVVDVRTDIEVATLGSYPGAIHVQSADLKEKAPKLFGKDDRLLLYCNSGQRARAAAEKLRDMGYSNVRYIAEPYQMLMPSSS